mgnify:CR=1 FL=1
MTETTQQYPTDRPFDHERSTRHRVLAVERRRVTCDALAACDEGPIPLEALADAVANRDPDVEDGDRAADDVATTLHHVHLPLLAEAGVLEYDAGANLVTYDAEALARYTN